MSLLNVAYCSEQIVFDEIMLKNLKVFLTDEDEFVELMPEFKIESAFFKQYFIKEKQEKISSIGKAIEAYKAKAAEDVKLKQTNVQEGTSSGGLQQDKTPKQEDSKTETPTKTTNR